MLLPTIAGVPYEVDSATNQLGVSIYSPLALSRPDPIATSPAPTSPCAAEDSIAEIEIFVGVWM